MAVQREHADLKLYTPTGIYEKNAEFTDRAECWRPKSTRLEVLTGKVIKYMFTCRGSDAFNPEYGGISMHHSTISQAYLPKLMMEIADDLERCTRFIIENEKSLPESLPRLSVINLLDVQYSDLTRDRITVKIEIITNTNESAVVALKDSAHA